jgi:hypothetical protein
MNIIEIRKRDKSALIAELTQAGAKFKGNTCTCPYHDDTHPSAGIFQTEVGDWFFKCQSCQAKGDVWDIIARNEGKDVSEVIKTARNEAGARFNKPVSEPKGRIYFTIEELKAACPGKVEMVNQYINPVTQKPDMIVIRCMTDTGKTFRQVKPSNGGYEFGAPPKPWPLYNRIRVSQVDTVVVVEGEKCVHVLHDYNIVATTSPAGAGKAEYADWQPLAGKNVILWPDNDIVGHKHMQQVESILQKIEPAPRISIIEPSDLDLAEKEDCVDYIEQLKTIGVDVQSELLRVIQAAKPKGVTAGLSERLEAIISGKFEVITLPWYNLSSLSNAIMPGTVTLLCGSPGASKSFMLLQALSYWIEKEIKACIYELEEDREFHLMRVLAQKSGISEMTNFEWVKNNPDIARRAQKENADFLETIGRCIWVCPDNQPTLDQLAQWSEKRAESGNRIICIDPVTAAAQTGKPWIEDNAFLQRIKRAATGFGCSFVLITHPAKTMSLPDMNQLAGSAAYSRFAQSIFWLHSHEPKSSKVRLACGTTECEHDRTLYILKARNGRGHGFSLAYEFDKQNLTLKESGVIIKKGKDND